MPLHDWTRVRPGTFHDFHTAWITHLKEALNAGVLPPDYYALAEQSAGEVGPDVLTLQRSEAPPGRGPATPPPGVIAVAERPPRVDLTVTAESAVTAARRRTLVIRHATGDRIVALIEILSPGNKSTRVALDAFLDKAVSALRDGYHLLLIDVFPPGRYDPEGVHGAVWAELEDAEFELPPGRPLTVASYAAGLMPTAYVKLLAVGAALPDMPLFLDPGAYVDTPLEPTYERAWRGVPQRWREVIEGGPEDGR